MFRFLKRKREVCRHKLGLGFRVYDARGRRAAGKRDFGAAAFSGMSGKHVQHVAFMNLISQRA